MALLQLRNCTIEQGLAYSTDHGRVFEITLRFDLSDVLCKEMRWPESLDGVKAGTLDGSLYGARMVAEPTQANNKSYGFEIDINRIYSFKAIPVTKNGEVTGHRGQCIVSTTASDAFTCLENWFLFVADNTCLMKLHYNEEKQTELDIEQQAAGADPLPPRKKSKASASKAN